MSATAVTMPLGPDAAAGALPPVQQMGAGGEVQRFQVKAPRRQECGKLSNARGG